VPTLPDAGRPARRRSGCARTTSATVGALSGLVALVVATRTALLYFDNLYGPLGAQPRAGALTGLACGLLTGAVVFASTRWAALRSRALVILLAGVVCAGAWVVTPRQVDVSESWVPRPNPRWSCTGWSFRHYPPETSDAAATTYCVGLEKRITDG
jgi:hypothetical protein